MCISSAYKEILKFNKQQNFNLLKVMDNLKLGPNGGLIFCMEYLEKNTDWLKSEMDKYKKHYFLFDCPGQVRCLTLL